MTKTTKIRQSQRFVVLQYLFVDDYGEHHVLIHVVIIFVLLVWHVATPDDSLVDRRLIPTQLEQACKSNRTVRVNNKVAEILPWGQRSGINMGNLRWEISATY